MKKIPFLRVTIPLLVLLCFCCKKPEYAGPGVQPSDDLLHGLRDNTQRIIAITTLQDSVESDETSTNLAGCINDPLLGVTVCSFYTQLHLTGTNVDFGSAPVLDSAVISLAYYNYYGDTTTVQTFHVRELTDYLVKDSIYYSNKTFGNTGSNLGFCTKAARPTDSVSVGGVMTAPHLRIKLDVPFGNRLLSAAASGYLTDNPTFNNFFKGILFQPDSVLPSGKGAILYFDLLNAMSKLTLYYNHGSSYDFIFDDQCARINHCSHHYDGTAIEKQVAHTASDTNFVFVQGTAGVCTDIQFPELRKIRAAGPVIVNKAELVIPVISGTTTTLGPPIKILLAGIDSLGGNQILPDQAVGAAYFGGIYDNVKGQYTFNLAKYVQNVIDDSLHTDYGIRLVPSGSAVSAARVVLGSGSSSDRKMKLNLVYTRY